MELRLDTGAKTVELHDPDNCDDFAVVVTGSMDPAEVDETIAGQGAGRLVGPDAWIAVHSLREWASGKTGDGWDARFQRLLDEAGRNGRMNDDRTYLMAHLTQG